MKLKKNLHWFIYILFTLSCARQTTPTGGPKDTIPPTLVNSVPAANQILFKGKTVQLTFNEMIALANPKEQIIIAPSVDKEYEISYRNKIVIIEFENKLRDSTTYTLNFRDAVQDITEKNPVKNLHLAFSTGTYVDSLSMSGSAYDLLKGTELKDITVAIYDSDTFNIFKHKPTYLTKTDAKGKFKLTNLKHGNYTLYAIDDKNKNLITDSRNESYGFLSKKLNLYKDSSDLSIPVLRLDARALKLSNGRPYNNYFNIKTSKNLLQYSIEAADSKDSVITAFGEDHANIRVYNNLTDKDSLKISFIARDSIGNALDTTLFVKFSKRQTEPEKFSYGIEAVEILKERGTLTASMSFNKPTRVANLDSIFFQIDSLKKISFTTTDFTWNSTEKKLTLFKAFDKTLFAEPKVDQTTETKPAKQPAQGQRSKGPQKKTITNQFVIGKAAFISVDNDSTRHLTKDARPLKTEELGIVKISIKSSHPNHVTTLTTKDGKVIKQSRNRKTFDFTDVPPGEYIIKVIIDINNNGKWDPGNYFTHSEPEPVIFYRNEKGGQIINLKANWELGPLLITY